jgi:hypothetical protein
VLGDRPEVQSSTWLRQQAVDLEARLLDTEDAVDQLIAQFASTHMQDDSSEKQPGSADTELANPTSMDDHTPMDDAAIE